MVEYEQPQQGLVLVIVLTTSLVYAKRRTLDINPTYSSSLESIHDSIHSYVGGDNLGHMAAPVVAGKSRKT